jgi:hypothetical protein
MFEEFKLNQEDITKGGKFLSILGSAIANLTALDSKLEEYAVQANTKIGDFEKKIVEEDTNEKNCPKGSLEEAMKFTERKGLSTDPCLLEIESVFNNASKAIEESENGITKSFDSILGVSKICKPKDMHRIKEWIGPTCRTLKLLFSAKMHGYTAKEFHKRCDGIAPNLVIARNSFGKIVGAYSILPWQSSPNEYQYTADPSKKCFLFSITLDKKYNLVSSEYAICNSMNHGPKYGGGHDFEIVNNCNTTQNQYYNVGYSYEKETYERFYGGMKFFIEDYEVYHVLA